MQLGQTPQLRTKWGATPVAGLPVGDALADLRDFAGCVDAHDVREVARHTGDALADVDIDVIDSRGAHPHQHFTRTGARRFDVLVAHGLGPAVAAQDDGFHCDLPEMMSAP